MKKYFNFIKTIAYIFIFIFMFEGSYCFAKESIQEVSFKKEWTIKFSSEAASNTINNQNIVVKDSNNNVVKEVNIILLKDGQTIRVTAPQEGYKPGEKYTLIIKDNIYSKKGNKLKEGRVKDFVIEKEDYDTDTQEPFVDNKEKTPIIGKSDLSVSQMVQYVLVNNPEPKLSIPLEELAQMFLQEGAIEGVRGDIAFCQSIKETGFFRYGGQVLPEQNNYAGIGATNNSPIGKGAWFEEPRQGVRAQIQHLKGYATKVPLKNLCIDPRYSILQNVGLLGVAPNWQDLNGRWAVPGLNYGQDIIKIYKIIKQYR